MINLTVKQVSSLEKIGFSGIDKAKEISHKTLMKGESFSYQIAVKTSAHTELEVEVISPLKDYVKLYAVKDAVLDRVMFDGIDENYLTDKPCCMPDILVPFELENNHVIFNDEEGSVWVKVDLPEDVNAGTAEITLKLTLKSENLKLNSVSNKTDTKTAAHEICQTMTLDIINSVLPKREMIFTQWLHADCIADVHKVKVYSDEHWDLIGKYMNLASQLGVNMIMCPIVTPPLDTGVGIKRTSVQLVKIEKSGDKYTFDFTLLKRWIETAKANNIEYFEMAHLFTQGGAEYAPDVIVRENGKEKYIFGWETKADSKEYEIFLKQFIPALVEFLEQEGEKEKCWFHVSDEPMEEHIENYKYAHELLKPMLGDCPMFDAISDYDFYENGLITNPVVTTNFIEKFIENKAENLWAYYCCGQGVKVANRFMSMPSARNRISGIQLYKFDIKGFLHWGFNFYYSKLSKKVINPYVTTSADKGFPSGDPFSVYPVDGGAIPSLRGVVFKEALNDIAICKKLESYIGRDKVVEMIDTAAGMDLTFSKYPKETDFVPNLIEEMEKLIKTYEK